jgi:hypothetical protein
MFTSWLKKVSGIVASSNSTRRPSARLDVEALGDRIVPSVDFVPQTQNDPSSPHTAIIIGDSGADTFVVRYDGSGGITVTDEQGAFHSHDNVTGINITTHSGNDVVRFVLDGTLTRDLDLNVNMVNGNDRFTGTLEGNILANVDLSAYISGGAGDDLLTMYGTETAPARANDHLTNGLAINPFGMRIGSGATLDLTMVGDGDDDRIYADYDGELDGTLQLKLLGEEHQDTVSAIVELRNGSTGRVGSVARSALVHGGTDNDNVTFFIYNPPDGTHLTHRARIDGGYDFFYWANDDIGFYTNNVTAVEVERPFH